MRQVVFGTACKAGQKQTHKQMAAGTGQLHQDANMQWGMTGCWENAKKAAPQNRGIYSHNAWAKRRRVEGNKGTQQPTV